MAENVAREDMTPLEEGDGFAAWKKTGASVEDMAAEVGRPVAFVRQRLQLAALPGAVRAALSSGVIGVGHALLIGGLPSEQLQAAALQQVAETVAECGECTVRDLASWVRWQARDLAQAPWQLGDAQLVLSAPACTKCTKRTGATVDLFPGVTEDRCLDAECWAMKLEAHQREQKRMAPPAAPAPKKGRELPAAAPAPAPAAAPSGPVRGTVNPPSVKRSDRRAILRAVLDDLQLDEDGRLRERELRLVVDELTQGVQDENVDFVAAAIGLIAPGQAFRVSDVAEGAIEDLSRMAFGLTAAQWMAPWQDDEPLVAIARSMGIEVVDPPPPAKAAPKRLTEDEIEAHARALTKPAPKKAKAKAAKKAKAKAAKKAKAKKAKAKAKRG
jgi:hypothetical protein